MKIRQIVEKHLHVWHGKYSKQGTKSMKKNEEKKMGEAFGLGRNSLGSDTKTWS